MSDLAFAVCEYPIVYFVTTNALPHQVHGKRYTSEKSIDLYITTGTASDW